MAVTHRPLVLTAEFASGNPPAESAFRITMIELVVLTVMIVAFVGSLLMLRHRHPAASATRA